MWLRGQQGNERARAFPAFGEDGLASSAEPLRWVATRTDCTECARRAAILEAKVKPIAIDATTASRRR